MPRNLLSSVLPLLISIILFILVVNFGVGRVLQLRSEITQANIDKNTLTQKLNTLDSLGSNLPANTEVSSIALPDKNPAVITLSQLKSLATQNLVSISNIKSGSSVAPSASLSSADLSFEVVGPTPAILSFLNGVHKIAPITVIGRVKMSQVGQVATAAVTVSSFWSPFPTQIPAVDQPINTLTPDEQTILSSVNALVPPQFSQLSPAQGGRANPFAQ